MSRDRNNPTRRGLFQLGARALASLGAAAAIGKLTEQPALAQRPPLSAGADHILVAIYLNGGNDSNNMVVPPSIRANIVHTRKRAARWRSIQGTCWRSPSSRSQQPFGFHPRR